MTIQTNGGIFGDTSGFARRSLFRGAPGERQPARPLSGLLVDWAEQAFILFAIITFSGIWAFGATSEAIPGTDQFSMGNRIGQSIVLTVVCVVALFRWREYWLLITRAYLLNAFILLLTASLLWSVAPDITLRRLVSFYAAILFALYMVTRFSMPRCIVFMGRAYLIIVVVSALMAIFTPRYGTMQPMNGAIQVDAEYASPALIGAWCGLFSEKNTLGWITICASQVYAWRWLTERGRARRIFFFLIMAFLVFVTVKTRSTTSLLSVALSIVLYPLLQIERAPGMKRIFAEVTITMLTIGSTVLLFLNLDAATHLLGKDATFTGRVPLWTELLTSVAKRPLLGYGYNAYWLLRNEESVRVSDVVGWYATQAHDAYLNMMLEIGIVGATLGIVILLSVLRKTLKLYRQDVPWSSYLAVFLIVFAVTNIVETRLFRSGDNYCYMMALFYYAVLKASIDDKSVKRTLRKPSGSRVFLPRTDDASAEVEQPDWPLASGDKPTRATGFLQDGKAPRRLPQPE